MTDLTWIAVASIVMASVAVSVGAGISDWTTYYVNTDITPFTRMYLHATPWSDPEIYRMTSPISYIAKAKTPTLIQHGGADHRVPLPNGYELRQALEDHGVPVKMVVYDGFGHPINKPSPQVLTVAPMFAPMLAPVGPVALPPAPRTGPAPALAPTSAPAAGDDLAKPEDTPR